MDGAEVCLWAGEDVTSQIAGHIAWKKFSHCSGEAEAGVLWGLRECSRFLREAIKWPQKRLECAMRETHSPDTPANVDYLLRELRGLFPIIKYPIGFFFFL